MRSKSRNKPPVLRKSPAGRGSNSGFLLLALCFLAGAGLGVFVGSFAGAGSAPSTLGAMEPYGGGGYVRFLWNNLRFPLAAVFFATTFLGVVLLPILSALRGYLIGCASSVLLCGGGGLSQSLILLGLPLFICLPCFFVLTVDAFQFSGRTLVLVRRTGEGNRPPKLLTHCLLCFSLIAVWTFVQMITTAWLAS